MKFSANTFGILAFTALATTAFVWMAKRPPVEGQLMQFGMPLKTTKVEKQEEAKEAPKLVDEKSTEEVEKVKADEPTGAEVATEKENKENTEKKEGTEKK